MLFKVINCVFFAGVSVRNIEAFQVLHTVFLKVKNSFFDGFSIALSQVIKVKKLTMIISFMT